VVRDDREREAVVWRDAEPRDLPLRPAAVADQPDALDGHQHPRQPDGVDVPSDLDL